MRAIRAAWATNTTVVCAGRRAGKSSTFSRLAVAEATAGWPVPHGDVGVYSIMSADREQAAARVATCVAVCEALEIPHEPTTHSVRFPDWQTEIHVKTASIRGAVSTTSIGGLFDEFAIWQDSNGANPAGAILSAFRPALLTMPSATLRLVSSPWTTRDPLAVEMQKARGPAADRTYLVHGKTWEANPTVTRRMCEEEGLDEVEFLRQFEAVAIDATGTNPFPPSVVAACMGLEVSA
jgi:hypothetical protein